MSFPIFKDGVTSFHVPNLDDLQKEIMMSESEVAGCIILLYSVTFLGGKGSQEVNKSLKCLRLLCTYHNLAFICLFSFYHCSMPYLFTHL